MNEELENFLTEIVGYLQRWHDTFPDEIKQEVIHGLEIQGRWVLNHWDERLGRAWPVDDM